MDPLGAPPGPLRIVGGRLIDGRGAEPVANPGLDIVDRRFAPATTAVDPATLDADGLTILPGLIDSHVHLTFTASDQVVADLAGESDDLLLLRASRHARAMLRSGVTTVRDCGGRGHLTASLKQAIARGIVSGPRMLVSLMPITTTAGHCHYLGLEADSSQEARVAVRRLVKGGADFVKVMSSGGNMTPGSNSLAAQYDADTLRAIVADAHRLGRRVAVHAHPAETVRSSVLAGADTIEHCSWLAPDGSVVLDEQVVARMVAQGTAVAPTLSGGYRLAARPGRLSPQEQARWQAQWAGRLAAYRRMLEAGVRLLAGTDAGASCTAFDDFALSPELLVSELGMSPMAALVAATSASAEALGLGGELGTVQPGAWADLVLVAGDPSVDIGALRHVRFVVQAGRVIRVDQTDSY